MKLAGTLPVIPTPFYEGGVDFSSLERLLEFTHAGVDGYTICGSTGEAPAMSREERMAVTRFVLRRVPRDKQVVVGVGHTDAREAAELARDAAEHGARAVLVPAPYYFLNSLENVSAYLATLCAGVDIDIVLYDNPYTTKTVFRPEELRILADRFPRLGYVKLTDHDLSKIQWIKAHTELGVFAGDDVVLFRSLLLGADGCMVIAPAVFPGPYQQVWQLLKGGKEREALQVFAARILPFLHIFGTGGEIATTKALFHHLGLFRSPEVRPPLLPCDTEYRRQIVLAYEECVAA